MWVRGRGRRESAFERPKIHACLQLFVMGHAAQARMAQSDILIVGLRGLGVEIGAYPAGARRCIGPSVG